MGLWVFTSDLHGHAPFYSALERLCAARHPAIAILGGDLSPHGLGDEGVARQREFFAGPFKESAHRLKRDTPSLRLFILLGNDDWAANYDVLEAEDGELWSLLHGRAYELDSGPEPLFLAGLSWVPITPFAVKDWERWDVADAPPGPRLDGFASDATGIRPRQMSQPEPGETIADALDELAKLSPPERTIYCLHTPPHRTHCDKMNGGIHVGSRAYRRFLERYGPPLSLSGHIHEAPRVSGHYRDRVGNTVVVNPGQFEAKQFCAVTFDPSDVEHTICHTVRG
jgi:Icc-related predicted phosphoesterase